MDDWTQVKQENFMAAAQWQQLHRGQRSQKKKERKAAEFEEICFRSLLARPKFTWSYRQFGFVMIPKRVKKGAMHKTELII